MTGTHSNFGLVAVGRLLCFVVEYRMPNTAPGLRNSFITYVAPDIGESEPDARLAARHPDARPP